MKQITLLLCIGISFGACKKAATLNDVAPEGTVLKTGVFSGNAHTTSGKVKIVLGVDNKKSLVFENFATDNGPDLRVWLSSSLTATGYQEIGTLKATNGSFYYPLTDAIDFATNNKVLIWCEDFSVLFGNAVLQ
jgi:Electron transfer DM13